MAPGVKSGSALVFDGVPGSGPVHTPSPRPSPPRCGGKGDGKTGRGAGAPDGPLSRRERGRVRGSELGFFPLVQPSP